jgi:CubicO group peptidase (beta-lactamase class C family)
MSQAIPDVQTIVQGILDQAVADGREDALQVAAYLHGELVVDAWAGPPELAIDGDSLFPFFSTGKGIAATAVHILTERGVLCLDDPVARHWPEFAVHGKGNITLRHVLSHTAGLPMMPEQGDMVLAAGWDGMCDYLANAAPIHPPGAERHYHAITYSWLVGEVAHRADGRDFATIVAEDICRPLGIDTLFFGVPESRLGECVDALPQLPVPPPDPAPEPAPPDPVAQRAIPPWVWPLEDWINSARIRRACIPASNGFGSARALARHYAALLDGGVDGVRLLTGDTLAEATRWDPATDGAIPGNGRWAMGYALQGPDDAPGSAFGHGGYGGSTAFADRRLGLAVGLVKSRMGGSITGEVVNAIRQACS